MTDQRPPSPNVHPIVRSGSGGGISTGAASRGRGRVREAETTQATPPAMRAARRRWASGVAIVTSVDLSGQSPTFTGATVSAFAVLSLDPPLVLIALETGSALARVVAASNIFAVSILDRGHEPASDRFSGYGPRPDGRFTGLAHEIAVTGCPVMTGALAWFDCLVGSVHEAGDHLAIHGQVVALGIGADTDDPLLNYEGAYRRLEGS